MVIIIRVKYFAHLIINGRIMPLFKGAVENFAHLIVNARIMPLFKGAAAHSIHFYHETS
jgi:hypothetical protein